MSLTTVLFNSIKKSINNYGIMRWIFSVPIIIIYTVSFALLIPEYKTPFQTCYEELNKKLIAEKSRITTPITLPSDLFYYSSIWQDMAGENPLVHTLMTSSLEYLFKSLNFLKDIQDNDEEMIKKMIQNKMYFLEQKKKDVLTAQNIFGSISKKGEYFTRLFDQLFSRHGLKKLGVKYSETDVEIFFNQLCRSPEEKKFRRLLGALVLNVPYYLVIKNSISEYYQNSDVLIPVDLFSFTLFMMFLDGVKKKETRPTIEECRAWVFSAIIPDSDKRNELLAKHFSVQQIIREEMIMPNPGYFSKGYNKKKHKAIDIASERGTMIRSPITGTVRYYEKSPKKSITGNFIIIKDEGSQYNIFICHMDNKDYIEEHSTEGELAEPIANLEPDWIHPLKKGQFFQVVGSSGKSTGAHTHIQIARRNKPYTTFDFLSVNKPYQEQFNSYLKKNSLWQEYSRNEELLLSVLGMVISKYDSTRHFTDRDPATLELYSRLQENYTPASTTIDSIDITLEEIPDNILRTYFSKIIQEQVINERYDAQLKYFAGLILQLNNLLKQKVPPAPALPAKAVPLTPWQIVKRKRKNADTGEPDEDAHGHIFYQAINKYFLFKLLQLNYTPREIRDRLLSDPAFTGNTSEDITDLLPEYRQKNIEDRITALKKYIQGIIHLSIDFSFINDENFCGSIFSTIITACKNQGVPLYSNFGFFRYDIDELQKSYQESRFIKFSESPEFVYDKKHDDAIRTFFLDLLELGAEHKYFDLFRQLFSIKGEPSSTVIHNGSQRISKVLTKTFTRRIYKLLFRTYPPAPEIYPPHLYPAFQKLIENIVKPAPYEIKKYAGQTLYRASETALLYSLIYEFFLSGRECYMELFPAEELTNVIDAIGLFDNMFRMFCENTARKQLIDTEHSRITQELETAERELNIYKKSKVQLQEDFRKDTVSAKQADNYLSRNTDLFSKYFMEEEKINEKITGLEQTLDRYRNECIVLKNEKTQMQKEHEVKLETMAREMETLRSKGTLDQDRYRIKMKNISYHKEKAEREIIELKEEINHLKKELKEEKEQFSYTLTNTEKDLEDAHELLKKYKKAIIIRNTKNSDQEKLISDLSNEISSIRKTHEEFIDIISSTMGLNEKEMTMQELSHRLLNLMKQAEVCKDQTSAIRVLQEQQKNDKQSLMLNASLINELKDKSEKLQIQLDFLQKTTTSTREKDLEEENEHLSASVRELKEEIRTLHKLISK
ncbi:MAG TPA: hypothetical protein PLY36_12220 [Spirochaetota bacterium]|nr:hypothetical protein [Spirochaetota bacterium]